MNENQLPVHLGRLIAVGHSITYITRSTTAMPADFVSLVRRWGAELETFPLPRFSVLSLLRTLAPMLRGVVALAASDVSAWRCEVLRAATFVF